MEPGSQVPTFLRLCLIDGIIAVHRGAQPSHTMHYAAVEKLGSKWSTLATYFSKDFHTKSAKFLTELSEDPNNLKTRIIKEKKSTKNEQKTCCWCLLRKRLVSKKRLDKCKNICFEHIFSKHQQVAKKMHSKSEKYNFFAFFSYCY